MFFSKKYKIFVIKDDISKNFIKLNKDIFNKIENNYSDYDSLINDEILSISQLKKLFNFFIEKT